MEQLQALAAASSPAPAPAPLTTVLPPQSAALTTSTPRRLSDRRLGASVDARREAWHRHWYAVWEDERQDPDRVLTPEQVQKCAVYLAGAWSTLFGESRSSGDLLAHLTETDLRDPEVAKRGWLGLFALSIWGGARADQDAKAPTTAGRGEVFRE